MGGWSEMEVKAIWNEETVQKVRDQWAKQVVDVVYTVSEVFWKRAQTWSSH